jgi:hypothetical protein
VASRRISSVSGSDSSSSSSGAVEGFDCEGDGRREEIRSKSDGAISE